jgi:4-hydroxy-3-methylbut-2-en-1-yl diphosphate synthase IspG/GcpE
MYELMDVQTMGTQSLKWFIVSLRVKSKKKKKMCNSYRSILKKQQLSLHIQFTKILKIYNIISAYE